jgi:hypothetical protein
MMIEPNSMKRKIGLIPCMMTDTNTPTSVRTNPIMLPFSMGQVSTGLPGA